jgi:hypothetical protein
MKGGVCSSVQKSSGSEGEICVLTLSKSCYLILVTYCSVISFDL